MLYIQIQHLQSIKTQAEKAYPEECCGLLLGQVDSQVNGGDNHGDINADVTAKMVAELWPVPNAWGDEAQTTMANRSGNDAEQEFTAERRYWIDPKDILAAQKQGRSRNLQIIGIYHSHPDHPAQPSECDRLWAWPDYSYIIVSVLQGQATDVLSWVLDEEHQFQHETLIPDGR